MAWIPASAGMTDNDNGNVDPTLRRETDNANADAPLRCKDERPVPSRTAGRNATTQSRPSPA